MDAAVQGVLSHTRLLPYELLTEIFLKVAEPSYPARELPLPPPLLLGQVCSTWRLVAHGTPKLWTRFSLEVSNESQEGKVDHVSFAKAWLSRAHPYPLHVCLYVESPIALGPIMDVIIPFADRLQVLELSLTFPHFHPLVNIRSMALLESVFLSADIIYDVQGPALWARRITAFMAAPCLRKVTIFAVGGEGLFCCGIQMPWSQLTELCIEEDGGSADGFRDVFLQCTNLVDCTLHMATWEEEVIPNIPIVVLPHLQKLDITFTGPGHSFPFFQPLSLPALKSLTITIRGDCTWSHEDFMEFALCSLLDLERLSFKRVPIYPHELLQILTHTQSLIELDIASESLYIDTTLFDALSYREMDGQHLLPKLEALHIFESWGDDVVEDSIAGMVESRWWTDDPPRKVSRLKRAHLDYDFMKEHSSRLWERLERCCREGLTLARV